MRTTLKAKSVKVASRLVLTLQMAAMLAFSSAFALPSAMAANAPSQDVKRTVLERHDIPGTDEEMQMILVDFPPGATSSPHHHPVTGLVYIIEGTAESAYGNDAPKIYHAGDTMQDIANVPHTLFRNPDNNHPLRFLIFANLHKGQSYRVMP